MSWPYLDGAQPRQVVEIAPAYGLDEEVRVKLHADAVKIAKHVGYVRTSPNANLLYNPPVTHGCIGPTGVVSLHTQHWNLHPARVACTRDTLRMRTCWWFKHGVRCV